MASALPLAIAAPVVGLGLAYVLPRRRAAKQASRPKRPTLPPVVVQRGDDVQQLLIPNATPKPGAAPTATPDVYCVQEPCDVSRWPALVTLGRIGDDEILVDLTRVGVVALTGDRAAGLATIRSVWAELRWPSEAHELEVVGVGALGIPGLRNMPWPHAITLLERGPERSRPLVVLAADPPTGDATVRLAAATRPDQNVGVLVVGEWDCAWQLRHRGDRSKLSPLGLDVAPVGEPELTGKDEPTPVEHRGVHVSLLGPVEVIGCSLRAKETELVAFLATRPAGATEAQVRTALWPHRDAPRGTFNNLVCATRRHLGTTPDGERLLPRVVDGRYRLHPSVSCDLRQLEEVLERCRETDARSELIGVLLSLRGRPFDGWTGADWPFDDAVVSRAELLITRAAQLVADVANGRVVEALSKALEAVQDPTLDEALRRRLSAAN